jgi:methyl coenzyme M reductase subunit D
MREIVDMSNDAVDQVRTVSHALEKRVEICGAAIRFRVQLGQISLKISRS